MALQPDGTLLIGTTKGMVWKRPGQPNLENSPTLPYLSEIQCDGAKWPESQWMNRSQFTFPPGYHTLQFRAKALDLGGSTKHRFRYRFLGASEVWVESKTGEITWLDAPPGEYRLEIQVLNAKQEPGEKLSLSLHLPFKWYQQTLVQVAFALAILLVLWLFIWRWIRMREKNIQEKARLHEQVSVLELKTIQQKLNPHFLTNALSNLNSLLRYGEKEKAQHYLENFGQILYQSLHQQDKDAISLKEELDFFRYYFDVENMRLEQSVTLRMDLEDGLDLDDLWVPPLITQPLVENAFKHAFAAGQAGLLWIQIYSQEDQVLGMSVTSTGLPMYEQKNRIGLGLSLVKKRMEKVYGMAPSAWVTWKKTNDNQFEVRLRFPQS
jgi:two-component sensor histidine kinase